MFVSHRKLGLTVIGLSVSALIIFSGISLTAQAENDPGAPKTTSKPMNGSRLQFMEGKMAITQEILRGVVLRDFKLIEKGATGINVLTLADQWMYKDTKEYVRMSEDLRRISRQLVKAGREKDINAATLAYQRLTLNCVECHQALNIGME
jgi:hypothetical protein